MQMLNRWPDELQWNVIQYLGPRPSANSLSESIQETRDKYLMYKIELEDLAKMTMEKYKEKCRKKPKHGKLMDSEIRYYRIYLRKCATKGIKPEPFYKKALGCYA